MEYKDLWWDTDDYINLNELLEDGGFKGWEIIKMFLVYTGEQEAYRIILKKP